MTLRKKLISSISALCLLVLTLVVGVWAVTSATYNLGGTVSFIAKGVSVRVYDSALLGGTYEGELNSNVVPENKMQSFEVDTYKQGSQSQFEDDLELITNFNYKAAFCCVNMENDAEAIKYLNKTINMLNEYGRLPNDIEAIYQKCSFEKERIIKKG